MRRDIPELLRAHDFTRSLADAHLAIIAGCAQNFRFAAGDYIFREGEPADRFYLIRHGRVALEMNVRGRGQVTVRTLEDDDILGVAWLVPPHRCTFSARALTPTRAIGFDAVCLRGKCEADHHLGYALMMKFTPELLERLRSVRLQLADVYGTPHA